ncbi:MAG TPA: hypothetical protein VK726_02120 [Acetobacteraceae bacterium]|nr:hypothetical protein [Acetobacteraceae bacterium]
MDRDDDVRDPPAPIGAKRWRWTSDVGGHRERWNQFRLPGAASCQWGRRTKVQGRLDRSPLFGEGIQRAAQQIASITAAQSHRPVECRQVVTGQEYLPRTAERPERCIDVRLLVGREPALLA